MRDECTQEVWTRVKTVEPTVSSGALESTIAKTGKKPAETTVTVNETTTVTDVIVSTIQYIFVGNSISFEPRLCFRFAGFSGIYHWFAE
jgi:hypothetical protein